MGYITGLASAKTNLQKQSSRGVSGKLPPRKIAFRSGSGFGLGLALELGLGGNFPRTIQKMFLNVSHNLQENGSQFIFYTLIV